MTVFYMKATIISFLNLLGSRLNIPSSQTFFIQLAFQTPPHLCCLLLDPSLVSLQAFENVGPKSGHNTPAET